jgi:hypothetical protein
MMRRTAIFTRQKILWGDKIKEKEIGEYTETAQN